MQPTGARRLLAAMAPGIVGETEVAQPTLADGSSAGAVCSSVTLRSPLSGRLEDLARRSPRRALGVQCVLQDQHGRGLVDHGAPLGALRPRSRSIASAETVVRRSSHSLTGTGCNPAGQRDGELADLHGRRTLAPGQRPGQPDDHLDRGLLLENGGDPGQVALARDARSPPASRGTRTGRCGRRRSGRHPGRCPSRTPCRKLRARPGGRPRLDTSASASSIRDASVPPPWATSSLPPPLPPTSGPIARTSSLALTPARAGLVVDRRDDRRPCRPRRR